MFPPYHHHFTAVCKELYPGGFAFETHLSVTHTEI